MTAPGVGFADPIIAGDGSLIRTQIKSPNYVAGVSGWSIFANGNSEFNAGTFRGDLLVGPTTGAHVSIGNNLPAALVTRYITSGQFSSISSYAILEYPNSTDYYYQVVGTEAFASADAMAAGWVRNTSTVAETQSIEYSAGTSQTNYNFGSNSNNPAYSVAFRFRNPAVPANVGVFGSMLVEHSNILLGASLADVGSLTGYTPATWNNTSTFVGSTALPFATTLGTIPMGAGILDAVLVTTTGALTAAASAETDIPNLALTATLVAGRTYYIAAQCLFGMSVTTDNWEMRARLTTAVTGTEIMESDGPGTGNTTAGIAGPYSPAASGAVTIHISFLRRAGTGTITAFGSPGSNIARAWALIADVSPATAWRTA